jgi:hypothetical protein
MNLVFGKALSKLQKQKFVFVILEVHLKTNFAFHVFFLVIMGVLFVITVNIIIIDKIRTRAGHELPIHSWIQFHLLLTIICLLQAD